MRDTRLFRRGAEAGPPPDLDTAAGAQAGRTPALAPHSLPLPLSRLIGRQREVADVKQRLLATRLLTLTGPGGAGKTRLALQVASDLAARGLYPEGVSWADLADLTDPSLVPQAAAAALAVLEQPGRPLLDTLVDALRPTTSLLILDNCEHLLPACVALVGALLRTCPGLTVLATSREPLRIGGEVVYPTPPLSTPAALVAPAEYEVLAAADIMPYEAVQLFVERATAALPSFHLSDENAAAVAEICRRLDGLPLALELAATWLRVLSVADIATRLDTSLRLLTRGDATAPQRHQTLRATIDWSYALLSEVERVLLNRLAVFAGGFSLDAVESVCAGPRLPSSALLETLANLADKSLVVVVSHGDERDHPARYRLLETIRQYGREKLVAAGENELAHNAHLAWCLALAEGAVAEIQGPRAIRWLQRLEEEHENMRAALVWSQATGQVEVSLRLAAALHWFWERRGHLSEGRARLAAALELADSGGYEASTPDPTARGETVSLARAQALLGAAALAFDQGDMAAARSYAEESISLFRALVDHAGLALATLRLGFALGPASERGKDLIAEALALSEVVEDPWVVATVHYVVGQSAYFRADYAVARPYLEDALRLTREVGDALLLPRILSILGGVDLGLGEVTRARVRLEEALALAHETHDPRATALVASGLGDVARCQGDYARAAQVYTESLDLHRALGNPADVAAILHNLGYVALGQGDVDAAYNLMAESLTQHRQRGDQAGVVEGLAGLAAVALARGQPQRAARLLGSAEVLGEGVRRMVWPAERFEWNRTLTALRAQLDGAALTVAWAEGRALTEEQAIGYALTMEAAGSERDAGQASARLAQRPALRQAEKTVYGGLTRREREVAALIARGYSNRAIAERLVIGERTAERHVANILAKLGFHARAQIAAWAVEKGLAGSE